MRELEYENARLKQMYTDLSLESLTLKDVIEKTLRPAEKRELACFVHEEHGVSVTRACAALRLSRTVFAY